MPDAKQRAFILTNDHNKHYSRRALTSTEATTLNTENQWLNVIITRSKFIPSPFICLFSTIIPVMSLHLSHPYTETTLL